MIFKTIQILKIKQKYGYINNVIEGRYIFYKIEFVFMCYEIYGINKWVKNMINLSNINKEIKNRKIINNLNLFVEKGEFIVIMGKSGSGKSTLLKIIAGLLKLDSGKVVIDNKNITNLNNEKLAEYRLKNIGIVFQDYQLLDIFTAYENIIFPARVLKKEDTKTIRNKANYFIKMANLENEKDKNITELSGGEKQRVAFARAFMNTPKVILADEPTGALDSKNADNLIKFIRESIKKLGQTMIMVSHDSYVAAYADKVYFLKDGNIISNLSFDRTNIDIDLGNRVDLIQRELLKINI